MATQSAQIMVFALGLRILLFVPAPIFGKENIVLHVPHLGKRAISAKKCVTYIYVGVMGFVKEYKETPLVFVMIILRNLLIVQFVSMDMIL